jgi:hypothetical protein
MSRLNRMIGGSSNAAPQTLAVKQTINISEPVIDKTAKSSKISEVGVQQQHGGITYASF